MKVNVIIVAGGSSTRMGFCKITHRIDGFSVLERAVIPFLELDNLGLVVICVNKNNKSQAQEIFGNLPVHIIEGGSVRAQSSFKGLEYINSVYKQRGIELGDDIVLIHDGARPFVSNDVIKRCINTTLEYGSGIVSVKVKDTIRYSKNNCGTETPDRNSLRASQTPQGFRLYNILQAYNQAYGQADLSQDFYDDAQVYIKKYGSVHFCEGCYSNIKITTLEDLK